MDRSICQGGDRIKKPPLPRRAGEHDRIVPPCKSESLGMDLPHAHLAVLHDCGHLSHEEAPSALLEQLVPFCGQVLCQAIAASDPAVTAAPFVRGPS